LPPLNVSPLESFLVEKFSSKNTVYGSEDVLTWENMGAKFKILGPRNV